MWRVRFPAPVVAALAFAAACGGSTVKNVGQKPTASFTATQSTVRAQVFHLDASGSLAPVGRIAKYLWTFGDEALPGDQTAVETPTTVHAYKATGPFTISLVVQDDSGTQSDPVSQSVTVPSIDTSLPKANISGPVQGDPGQALTYDGSMSTPAGDIQNYEWMFQNKLSGARESMTGKTATYAFPVAAKYGVNLTVTDSLGQSDTTELLVAIGNVGPLAACSWTPQPAVQGMPLTFDGSQSLAPGSTIRLYVWDFGDGSPQATGKTAQHTYNVQATFKPTLQVIDQQNRVGDASCAEVNVQAPPLCSADYSLDGTPKKQTCLSADDSTWVGVEWHVTETADGKITATEQVGEKTNCSGGTRTRTITYLGTWTGSAFTMTTKWQQIDWQMDPFGGGCTQVALDKDDTVNGRFNGCATWTGTWVEKVGMSGFPLCTLTWTVSGTKL